MFDIGIAGVEFKYGSWIVRFKAFKGQAAVLVHSAFGWIGGFSA